MTTIYEAWHTATTIAGAIAILLAGATAILIARQQMEFKTIHGRRIRRHATITKTSTTRNTEIQQQTPSVNRKKITIEAPTRYADWIDATKLIHIN